MLLHSIADSSPPTLEDQNPNGCYRVAWACEAHQSALVELLLLRKKSVPRSPLFQKIHGEFIHLRELLEKGHPISEKLFSLTDLQLDWLLKDNTFLLGSIVEALARHNEEQTLISQIYGRPIFHQEAIIGDGICLALVKGYCSGGFLEKAESIILSIFSGRDSSDKKEAIRVFWRTKAERGPISLEGIPEKAFEVALWTDFWLQFLPQGTLEQLQALAENRIFLHCLDNPLKVCFVQRALALENPSLAVSVLTSPSRGSFLPQDPDLAVFSQVFQAVCSQPPEPKQVQHFLDLFQTLTNIQTQLAAKLQRLSFSFTDPVNEATQALQPHCSQSHREKSISFGPSFSQEYKTIPLKPYDLEAQRLYDLEEQRLSQERLTTTWALVCADLLVLYPSRPKWQEGLGAMLKANDLLIRNVQKYFTREERTNTHDAIEGFPWDTYPKLAPLRQSLGLPPKS